MQPGMFEGYILSHEQSSNSTDMFFDIKYCGTIVRWLPIFLSGLLVQLVKNSIHTYARQLEQKQLSPVTLEFKKLIEEDAGLLRDFHEMFTQVRPHPSPNQPSVSR